VSRRFLLQMAGTSAAGKSTLARAIGRATGAVVIDKDYIKAPMLAPEVPLAGPHGVVTEAGGVPEQAAGHLSYEVFFELTASILAQGFSVIMDSPASFVRIREKGAAIADAHGAGYFIIRCVLTDLDEVQRRMDARVARVSQPVVAGTEVDYRPGTAPLWEPHLALDMGQPIEVTLKRALEYLGRGQG
jgi:predicted kinase